MPSELEKILKHYPEITGVHPACLAVPEISDEDRAILDARIASQGLRHEIVLTEDGLLIDGRNRLLACYRGSIEPRFRKVATDPWQVAYDENIARRHLGTKEKAVFSLAWRNHEKLEAKKRQARKPEEFVPVILPEQTGDSRDKIGKRVGVSGRSIDKVAVIADYAPEKLKDDSSLEEAYKEASKRRKEQATKPIELPTVATADMTTIVTASGRESQIALPKKVSFNRTNDSVDWASWTWNPVTGCDHGCKFCYAREIANSQRMEAYYPNKFEPTFHRYRLDAPKNTKPPESTEERDGRVFVCSMADLFGKWVPNEWINLVFESCLASPEWEYLFLTKWPARYAKLPLIPNAWYGASVIQQSDVSRIETAMQKFDGTDVVRWISMEPMLEAIRFNDLSWCNLVVIGAQTSTTQPDGFVPEFSPEFDWIFDVVNQCRESGVPYYLKANLGLDRPGMKLPKGLPC